MMWRDLVRFAIQFAMLAGMLCAFLVPLEKQLAIAIVSIDAVERFWR